MNDRKLWSAVILLSDMRAGVHERNENGRNLLRHTPYV